MNQPLHEEYLTLGLAASYSARPSFFVNKISGKQMVGDEEVLRRHTELRGKVRELEALVATAREALVTGIGFAKLTKLEPFHEWARGARLLIDEPERHGG